MAAQQFLMTTRLRIPQPRKNYIVREELFSKLDKIYDYKVILIQGSAGTGKTTLLSSYVKERNITDFKWISLDEDCDNVFLFWSYLIEAAGTYFGEDKEDLLELYRANFQKSNIEQLLIPLINALDRSEEIFIALDDFHHIKDEFLLQTIEFFLKNASDNVHLVLITRHAPQLYLAGINMEKQLLVIDEKDLKLSREAGARFLLDTLDLNLDDKTISLLTGLAEGWLGGLQLIATAISVKKEKGLKGLDFENSLVEDYLTREIFEFLSQEERDFLVSTSILPYFNEEIAVGIFDGIEFGKTMRNLSQKNVLISCVDEEKGIYRCHKILREYLKKKFKEFSKEEQKKLHQKAAGIFKSFGEYEQCIEQLILAEDYLSAMQLAMETPNNMALLSFAEKIPAEFIYKSPDFAYQSFFYHYINSEMEKCREMFEALKGKIHGDPIFLPFSHLGILAKDNYSLNEIITVPIEDIEKLPLKDTTKALLLVKEAAFLHNQRKYDEGLEFVEKAICYSKYNSNLYQNFISYSIKSQILEEKGELFKCEALYNEMEKILSKNKFIKMFNTSFFIGNTGVQLKKLDLDSAKKSLDRAEEYIGDRFSNTTIGYKYNLAEYNFLIGDEEQGLLLVKELMDFPVFQNLVYLSPLLQYVFRVNNFSGEAVDQFRENYETLDESNRTLESKLLYANILSSRGQTQTALELIDQILTICRMQKMKFLLVQASLAKINLIFDKGNNRREVINLFREALYYSSEDKILLPFFVEGKVVRELIKRFGPEIYRELNFKEKEQFEEISTICKVEKEPILSAREIEVLSEMAKGSANKEIAEKLCISLATVKSHIINIYSKLGVNNRVAAVETAKNQKILQER